MKVQTGRSFAWTGRRVRDAGSGDDLWEDLMADLAPAMWRHGYGGIPRVRARRGGGRTVEASLLGQRVVLVRGRPGVELFYDQERVERRSAVPAAVSGLVFGRGAVHGLDGDQHAHRRSVHTSVLDTWGEAAALEPLVHDVGRRLRRRVAAWGRAPVSMFDELALAHGTAAVAWSGCDTAADTTIAHDLASLLDGFGLSLPAYPRAWVARRRLDRWSRAQVHRARTNVDSVSPAAPLAALAATDLPERVAGVELLNLIRPQVAVAWLATFSAVAMALDDRLRRRLAAEDAQAKALRTSFAQELRRHVPFVPALVGRAREDLRHDGVRVCRGDRLVLDVVGTNRDPDLWESPDQFRADRFVGAPETALQIVAQGGGGYDGHRCPGEPLTVRLLAETAQVLASTPYRPVGDLAAGTARMPTLPPRGLLVRTDG